MVSPTNGAACVYYVSVHPSDGGPRRSTFGMQRTMLAVVPQVFPAIGLAEPAFVAGTGGTHGVVARRFLLFWPPALGVRSVLCCHGDIHSAVPRVPMLFSKFLLSAVIATFSQTCDFR